MRRFLRIPSLLIFILLIFQFSRAETTQITNFDELMAVLKKGKIVRVIIDYGKCQLISDNEIQERSPNAIGGMTMETFEYFAKNALGRNQPFVVSSENKLIANPKGEGYVYNYGKVRVDKDSKVKITVRYIDPKTYQNKMDESFYTEMNNGKNGGAASFYYSK